MPSKPQNKKPQLKKKRIDPFKEFTQDKFAIPSDIQKELDEKGLEGRWINLGTMKRYGGRHPKGWVPYKINKSRDEIELFGSGPSDYFQRGDLVLGVKTKEKAELHRAFLRQEARDHSVKNMIKSRRKELQDDIRQQGLEDSIKVVEGYDD